MTPRLIPLLEVSPVAASTTVTCKVPIGPRIRRILAVQGYASGTNTAVAAATNIAQMRFIIDDRVQRVATGTQWHDQNLLHGATYGFTDLPNTAPGVTSTLYFEEPWRPDEEDQLVPALPTKWDDGRGNSGSFGSIRIEIDLGAASTPTLVFFADVDDYIAPSEPSFIKWSRVTAPAGSTEFDYAYTHRPSSPSVERLIHASWYPDSGGSQTSTRIKLRDGEKILHDSTRLPGMALLTGSGLAPGASGRTATITDVKFDRKRELSDTYGYTAQHGLVFTVTAGSAMSGNCPVIIARLGRKE